MTCLQRNLELYTHWSHQNSMNLGRDEQTNTPLKGSMTTENQFLKSNNRLLLWTNQVYRLQIHNFYGWIKETKIIITPSSADQGDDIKKDVTMWYSFFYSITFKISQTHFERQEKLTLLAVSMKGFVNHSQIYPTLSSWRLNSKIHMLQAKKGTLRDYRLA